MEYKELRPANIYDVAANETWLEDMARQGWRLAGFTGWSGVFEKSDPAQCRYRMSPLLKKEKAPDPEWAGTCAQMGWAYVGTIQGAFHVWRCDDPDAPELDTDPVVQGEGYRYLERRMVRDGIGCLLLTAALLAAVSLLPASGTPLLNALERCAPGELLLRQVGGLSFLVLLACEVRSILRLGRSLRAGIPLARPRPYRRQKWLARVCVGAMVGILVLSMLGSGHAIDGSTLAGGRHLNDRDGRLDPEVVYADLRDLDGLTEDPVFMGCKTKAQELAPRIYTVRQYMDLPDGTQAAVHSNYYCLLTEGLARQLERELAQSRPGSLGVSPHGALEPIASDALDGFWWTRSDYDGQYVVARLGRKVLAVQYEGPTDLHAAEGYFAELLTREG